MAPPNHRHTSTTIVSDHNRQELSPRLAYSIVAIIISEMSLSQACLPVSRRRKREDGAASPVTIDQLEGLSAEEYLFQVVRQAEQLPKAREEESNDVITRAANNNRKFKGQQSVEAVDGSISSIQYLLNRSSLTESPPGNLPRKEWRDNAVSNFCILRQYMVDCKSQGIGGKSCRIPVPPMRDRAGWHIFCVGHKAAQGDGAQYYDSNDNTEGNLVTMECPAWQQDLPENGFEPTVSLVAQFDQVMVRRVLDHLIYYCTSGWDIPSRWLYSLLSVLEKPMHRQDAAMLYSLLKTCCKLRADWKTNREELARLNLLIVIVGVYFEQGGSECLRAFP